MPASETTFHLSEDTFIEPDFFCPCPESDVRIIVQAAPNERQIRRGHEHDIEAHVVLGFEGPLTSPPE